MQSHIETNLGISEEDHDVLWLKLLILLYADDTVILSDCAIDFQRFLHAFNSYCNEQHLSVNLDQTKVIIFAAHNTNTFHFLLGFKPIELIKSYHYFWVTFSASGSFLQARQPIVQQAKKAIYILFVRAKNADLFLDLTLKLFDHTVIPTILKYGSETLGFENLDIIETVHNFLRNILKARKSTPTYMLHVEVGQ